MDVSRPSESETRPAAVPQQRVPDTRPSGATPAPVQPPTPRRKGRLRRILLAVLLAVGVGVLGAVGYGFIWYDQETKLDRSEPDLVVSSYLRALLVERDDTRADRFVCANPSLDAIRALREETERREREFGVTVRVSWGALSRTPIATGRESVRTSLTIAGVSGAQTRSERTETWTFEVVDDGGWRVCTSVKTG